MESEKKEIEISAYKGDNLFNENTPFVINLFAPEAEKEEDEKRVSADLICVIDISGSMEGEKIKLVKESLKILVDMMEEKDRIALVLFDQKAKLYFNLEYLTKENKDKLKAQIEKIEASGGTNIASGLQIAVEILKQQKNNPKDNEERSSTVLLLSDGCDNYLDDIQLGEKLKSLTKGANLSFTLNTFGYGYDHDPKIMNKLANLRDGSFFLVEDYNNTFVLEIKVDESKIKPGDILLDINFNYDDILTKEKKVINAKYKWELKDLNFAKANEEYIRSQTYDVLERAIKLRESDKVKEGQKLLKEMREWLEKNYKGHNKAFLEDIKKAEPMFESMMYDQRGITYATSQVRQMQSKRIGNYNLYSNSAQMRLQSNYQMNYAMAQNMMNNNNNQNI